MNTFMNQISKNHLTLILAIFIISVSSAVAQVQIPMKAYNLKQVKAFVDTVLSNTRGGYSITEVDTIPDRHYGPVKFKASNGDQHFSVVFLKQTEGGNEALEIKGKPAYYFTGIYSVKYLDIFPLWKKYIDRDADKIEIAEKGMSWVNRDEVGQTKMVGLQGNNDKSLWSLVVK